MVSNGPLKVTLSSATNDGKWECRWEFYPRYATFTMIKADHPYWFLYEGVPNGLLEPGHDHVYRSTQQQNFLWERWSADVPAHEWVYFGDVKRKRSLFVAHHEDDTILDSYWTLEDTTTVFGYGRSSIEGEPVVGLIPTVPNRFTIGFIEDTTFARVADSLSSAYKPLTVTAGSAEQSSPLAPSLVAPASGATGLDIPLTFVWRSVPNANSYRLQISLDAAFTSLALEDSTLTDTTRVVTGLSGKTVYYWRVRAKNAGGSGDWSLTRQFQTGLGVPLLLSPAQGSTGQPVPTSLRWSVVKDATSYAFQVAHDALFTAVIIDQATMDTSASAAGLEAVTTYYWRVRALEGGSPGGYSSVWAFTTSVVAPVLVSPANDAGNIPLTVQLRWNRVSGAASYRLQVATDPGFATGLLVNTTGIGDTVYNLSGLSQSSRYYWRAGADGPGGPGPFSGTWSFSTSLPVPVLLAPGNSATAQPLTITFRWARVAGASAYRLQLATDAGFTTFIKNDSTITDTTRLVSGLQNSTQYFWRVSARNGSATSPFSGTWDFRTTGLLPGPVAQLSPADGAVLASDTALCTWAGDPLATRYWFEIAVDSLFQLRTVDSNGAQTSTVVRSLLQNQWYYWKVRGGNTDGWGPFSGVRKFKRLATSVSISEGLPAEYLLEQNYPNPFNPSTTIRYALPAADEVRLEVFGLTGDRVALLVDGAQPAGYHQAVFDASGLASGTYVYRLLVAGRSLARTMVILK